MQRSEAIGIGVAVIAHVVLFGLLSAGFLSTPIPEKPKQAPIDVSLVDNVDLQAKAPQAVEPPAESQAPDQGAPEDAAAAAKPEAEPDPVPPAPQPEAAPPPKPAPEAKPKPKKPVAPKPDKAETPPKREATTRSKAASDAKATGNDSSSTKARQRAERLGPDFLKGLSDQPSRTKSVKPQAPTMSNQAASDIGSAIKRQVQPCADRQVRPGPGAERIFVTIRLRLNRDGSLADNPVITGHSGVDDENSRYQDRVDDNAIATFKGCSPLRGLPQELYDVEHGWSVFTMRYNLKG